MSNEHIPTSEVEQDIRDTEREIAEMTAEAEHLEATPITSPDARWNRMRANVRRQGIENRRVFIEKLRGILKDCGVNL